ncbi:hypothetical protein [Cellulomonas cellasea]|uniref:Uncharacterized protein n=2 Tax=Cellulomonas cellasea TaxID=43670 RepID=A0A0A0BAK5_9CELL|nr:hypothetical protein [Cellulomonas cellasea]KGM03875.1 hypothetical protein Q760_07735 [Cellulomonas cellasea DSM 20118]GEA87350.1 hypothetical protein CCE01nite_12990 [Cellulomonas cellasea]
MKPLTSTSSPRRAAALGVVAVTLTVGAGGVAYALANADRPPAEITAGDAAPPAEDVARPTGDPTPADVVPATDVVAGADEYTQERSDAFWGAGYYMEDADALAQLWDVELLEAKGRAGQLLLDGQPVPVAPGSSLDLTDPAVIAGLQLEAYWDAGYTGEDGVALAALWDVEVGEAKATAGKMLRDGQPLPIGPSGTPVS